jgi:hypothetical protein
VSHGSLSGHGDALDLADDAAGNLDVSALLEVTDVGEADLEADHVAPSDRTRAEDDADAENQRDQGDGAGPDLCSLGSGL